MALPKEALTKVVHDWLKVSPTLRRELAKLQEPVAADLFWYCRTDAGWRYFPAKDGIEQTHPTGRYMIRTKAEDSGKRVYLPVKGDPAIAIQQHIAQVRAERRRPAARPHKPAVGTTHAPIVKAAPLTLEQEGDRYIDTLDRNKAKAAARYARTVLDDFTTICPDVKRASDVRVEHLEKFCNTLHERGQSKRTIFNKYKRLTFFLSKSDNAVKLPKGSKLIAFKEPPIGKCLTAESLRKHSRRPLLVELMVSLHTYAADHKSEEGRCGDDPMVSGHRSSLSSSEG